MRASHLSQWAELDAVLLNYTMFPYVFLSPHYPLSVKTTCLIGHANRYAHRLGRQWLELLGWILSGFPYRRGSPAHPWHFLRFLSRGPSAPHSFCLGGHQHPSEHAFYCEHATGERARDSRGTRPYRLTHNPLTRGLTDHPHSPTYRDAVAVRCGS